MSSDPFAAGQLFDPGLSAELTLADHFRMPPFSTLDARAGYWQERKNKWLALGIQSELGRDDNLLNMSETILSQWGEGAETAQARKRREALEAKIRESKERASGHEFKGVGSLAGHGKGMGDALLEGKPDGFEFKGASNLRDIEGLQNKLGYSGEGEQAWGGKGTSIFDPVLCELCYLWFTPKGGRILDPFAGGSVRGIVAAMLERRYLGVDLRPEQVLANEMQARAIGERRQWAEGQAPEWCCADSRSVREQVEPARFDFLFSCPPYFDLEQYSDDPADLSNAESYEAFRLDYFDIIEACAGLLKENRFAAFVVGEVRGKDGNYIGLVPDTIEGFRRAGLSYYNEGILITAVGSLPIRTKRIFPAGRKLGKSHQNLLVFCKGDWRKAAEACGPIGEIAEVQGGAMLPVEAEEAGHRSSQAAASEAAPKPAMRSGQLEDTYYRRERERGIKLLQDMHDLSAEDAARLWAEQEALRADRRGGDLRGGGNESGT